MTGAQVIEVARREIGYIGKKSNAQLDDPTANVSGNWTKYGRDLNDAGYYNGNKNGYDYCCQFVDWGFLQAAGGDKTKATSVKPSPIYGAVVKYVKQAFVQLGRFDTTDPRVGDQIIFREWNKTLKEWIPSHTGIITAVDTAAGKISTIEGNVGGHAVKEKSYKLTDSYIDGFCHPFYDEDPEPDPGDLKPGDIGRVRQGAHVYDKNGKDLDYEFNSWVYNSDVIVGEIQNGVTHFSTDLTLKAYTGWTACENILVYTPEPAPVPPPDSDAVSIPRDEVVKAAETLGNARYDISGVNNALGDLRATLDAVGATLAELEKQMGKYANN